MSSRVLAWVLAAVLAFPVASSADVTATTIHSFDKDDGWEPVGALVDGGDGFLYGATQLGGTGVTNPAGTVFRITPGGTLTSLYTFDFQVTGDEPFAGVVRLDDGTLLGTTRGSGSFNGSVYRLGTAGFTNLHSFSGFFGGQDGGHPEATLVEGGDGNLYGTTSDGGEHNIGTIYRIDALGDYEIVHSFNGSLGVQDGAYPRAALVRGDDGALYGTTTQNGPTQPSAASGTVFRFEPETSDVTTLHGFHDSDGAAPNTALVKGADGFLYGTASSGGAHNAGTVFRIREDGTGFQVLHAFEFTNGDGTSPVGLVAGSDGNLYGTTTAGGSGFIGTVFRQRPNGGYETVLSFPLADTGGYGPRGPLVQASDGDFYGTTYLGGAPSAKCAGGCGTVFRIPGEGILVPEPDAGSGVLVAELGLGAVVLRRRRIGRT